jgi:hypothetical protein
MTAKQHISAGAILFLPGLGIAGVSGLDELIGVLPDGKAIIITHAVTINPAANAAQITSQGTVSGSNFASVLTDDPDVAGQNATVTPVQLAPVLSNLSRNINEDQSVTFAVADFEAGFSDGNAGDALQVLRITSLPSTGTLFRSGGGGAIAAVPTDIPRAQIAGMQYLPQPNFGGPTASFGWNASDGITYAATPASHTFNITEQNDLPLPLPETIDRYATSSVKIPVATLLANDGDPADSPPDLPLTVTGVSSPTPNGAIVTLSGGVVYYDPNGHTGPDSFTYAVQDSRGGVFPNALVQVGIFDDTAQSLNITSIEMVGGDAVVSGVGIPGRTYRVQAADTGIPNWFDLPGGALAADGQGRFSYTDPGPLPPARIYRTAHP